MNIKTKKIILTLVLVASIVTIIGTVSFAYFTATGSSVNQTATISTAKVSAIFNDADTGANATLNFGESFTKKFTITNNGNVSTHVKMYWKDLVNTYTKESLSYTLSESATGDAGSYTVIVGGGETKTLVPQSASASTRLLASDIEVPVGTTYYELSVTLNYLNDVNQDSDLTATFYSWFELQDINYDDRSAVEKIIASSQGIVANFDSPAPTITSYTDDKFSGSVTSQVPRKEYYYTYANSYTFNPSTGTYTLVNPQVCKYSECYSNLVNKYIVSTVGSNTPVKESSSNISTIRKVTSASLNMFYYILSYKSPVYSGNGVYELADEGGTSYYFRGAVENNYVRFGKWMDSDHANYGKDMYWRIVRVNGDRSLRLIYAGTSAHSNSDQGADTFIGTSAFNTNYDDAKYVGYMYSPTGTTASTSKEQAQTNTESSTIKGVLETWYEKNLKDYDEYISKDAVFCYDRSTPGKSITGWDSDTGNGYGTNYVAFGATARTGVWNTATTASAPNFVCTQNNDKFTSKNSTAEIGNKKLEYPIGLISADEILAAGSGKYNTASNYYLKRTSWYWSGSPSDYNGSARVFFVNTAGDLGSYYAGGGGSVAPVINLTAEYAKTLVGEGTVSSPYHS